MQRDLNNCSIGITGLGLMGGAIALALRDKCNIPVQNIFACDKDNNILDAAQKEGLIGRGWFADNAGEMLSNCDIVFLCMNPSTILNFLARWESSFKSGCLITDIAGTKGSIAAAAEKIREDVDFIPGHPMAGSHIRAGKSSGDVKNQFQQAEFIKTEPGKTEFLQNPFANSAFCDFSGKNYILTPISRNKPENLIFLKELISRMGFARITEVTPQEHDNKIAFTSQLCHVIAASLVDCEPDTEITRFGGGSFEDLTRIAMLNAPMWTELFVENSAMLLDRINQFEKSLNTYKFLISGANTQELEKRLTQVKDRRSEMANTKK